MSEDRVYTIPLRDAYRVPQTKRAKVAVRIIREFVRRHTKADVVKLEPEVNEVVWERGIRRVPRSVKVSVELAEEEERKVATVKLYREG